VRNLFPVGNVTNPLLVPVPFKFIKEFILGRNHINALGVINLSLKLETLRNIIVYTQVRNHLNALSVLSPLLIMIILRIMKGATQERNHTNVIIATCHLEQVAFVECITKCTLAKNRGSALYVWSPFQDPSISKYTKEFIQETNRSHAINVRRHSSQLLCLEFT
jgi:hypothetical protein